MLGVKESNAPATYFEDVVRIPGFRESPDRCRPMKPVGFCLDGHALLGRSSCGTRYCSAHWRDWLEDAVIAIVARLGAYREVQKGAEKRMSHVTVSPPVTTRYTEPALWRARSQSYDVLNEAGGDAGAAIVHPYRTNERGDDLFDDAKAELPKGVGKWKFLRAETEDWDDLSKYITGAPHVHFLTAGRDIDGSRAPRGWVVERHRSFKRWHWQDMEAYESMISTAYYVLTHSADQPGRQTVTYFGDAHPATFDPEEELTTAKWQRIQLNAESAVKDLPGAEDEDDDAAHVGQECPCEGCTAMVEEFYKLREKMDTAEFRDHVRAFPDGEQRWQKLRGIILWFYHGADRPPPNVQADEERLLRWCEYLGRRYAEGPATASTPDQVSLFEAI